MMRFVLAGSFALVAAIAATAIAARSQGPAQDASAAALLAKHRAYVGWQFGDGTFTSMRIGGYLSDEKGEKTQRFVMLSRGLIYHNTYTLVREGGVTEHTGFTGNLFWKSDINGFTTPVYGDDAKYLASFTVLLHEGTSELPATFVRNATVAGKSVSVVRVTLANGDPIDCYVDPATGAYVQAVIDPDGSYETTIHILSYREAAPGKKMIASYTVDEDKTLHAFETFEPNVAIGDDQLHPPAATASWDFGNQAPFPITLTHARILVDVTVNGVKGRFILDTGADSIVLDDKFADRVNAPALHGGGEAMMMSGAISTRVRKVDSIALGGATLRNALVYSQDFRKEDYRGLDWEGYDGLMGYDLFAGAIVKLDVYASKMTILDPSTDLSTVHGLPLLVDLSDGVPAIPMTMNKKVPVNAHLDTGNPGIVFMSYDLAKKYHLAIATLGCGNLESLTIGPITYADQAVCTWGFPSNFMLLGFDFLKHFDFVFDYPHGRMFMTPNKN
jgi:predicted aspartyl protease